MTTSLQEAKSLNRTKTIGTHFNHSLELLIVEEVDYLFIYCLTPTTKIHIKLTEQKKTTH